MDPREFETYLPRFMVKVSTCEECGSVMNEKKITEDDYRRLPELKHREKITLQSVTDDETVTRVMVIECTKCDNYGAKVFLIG